MTHSTRDDVIQSREARSCRFLAFFSRAAFQHSKNWTLAATHSSPRGTLGYCLQRICARRLKRRPEVMSTPTRSPYGSVGQSSDSMGRKQTHEVACEGKIFEYTCSGGTRGCFSDNQQCCKLQNAQANSPQETSATLRALNTQCSQFRPAQRDFYERTKDSCPAEDSSFFCASALSLCGYFANLHPM